MPEINDSPERYDLLGHAARMYGVADTGFDRDGLSREDIEEYVTRYNPGPLNEIEERGGFLWVGAVRIAVRLQGFE